VSEEEWKLVTITALHKTASRVVVHHKVRGSAALSRANLYSLAAALPQPRDFTFTFTSHHSVKACLSRTAIIKLLGIYLSNRLINIVTDQCRTEAGALQG
jgi:hypothetical protein